MLSSSTLSTRSVILMIVIICTLLATFVITSPELDRKRSQAISEGKYLIPITDYTQFQEYDIINNQSVFV
jgi:hypothetical protein